MIYARLYLAALATILALLLASSLAAAGTARPSSRGGSAGTWCALVIKINTKYGAMKNKHYLPPARVSARVQKAIIRAAVAWRSQLLAAAPSAIKTAQRAELTFFAHLIANHFAQTTPLKPYSLAEARKLLDFQHAKCGITGP